MVEFAQVPSCRRRFILEYFGERWPEENCGACDVCLESREEFDATEIVQKILSAVVRTGERFGANHIIQVLSGSREKRILELGHDRLSVYGIPKDFGRPELREIIGHLQARGLLVRNEGEYPTLAVTAGGRQFIQGRQVVTLPRPRTADAGYAQRNGPNLAGSRATPMEYDRALFEELRALRRRLADVRDVPAFVIFGDVSLRHMAAAFPRSMEEFSRIHGVGEVKLEQYGPEFLEVIRGYSESNGLLDRTGVSVKRQQPESRRGATYDETKSLLEQRLSVSQTAQRRGLAETTIIGHLERMAGPGLILDLEHLLPSAEKLDNIGAAFDVCGSDFLRPVREFLGAQCTYDELRLARIYLRQEGRLSD